MHVSWGVIKKYVIAFVLMILCFPVGYLTLFYAFEVSPESAITLNSEIVLNLFMTWCAWSVMRDWLLKVWRNKDASDTTKHLTIAEHVILIAGSVAISLVVLHSSPVGAKVGVGQQISTIKGFVITWFVLFCTLGIIRLRRPSYW